MSYKVIQCEVMLCDSMSQLSHLSGDIMLNCGMWEPKLFQLKNSC